MTQSMNPFDPAGFATGGGLWDGKTVTITAAYFGLQTDYLGQPFADRETGQSVDRHGLIIKGIGEGDETERREQYGLGRLKGTADGEAFAKADGTPEALHNMSGAAKFFEALAKSGFDMSRIYAGGVGRISGLIGAKIEFVGVAKLNDDGTPLLSKSGKYQQQYFYPGRTVGYLAKTGNGTTDALVQKCRAIVKGLLAGGPISRVDLVRAIATHLKGDPDSTALVSLVVQDAFLKAEGTGWTYNGSQLSL